MNPFKWIKKWFRCKQLCLCFDCGTELVTQGAGDVSWTTCPECNKKFYDQTLPVIEMERRRLISETRDEFFAEGRNAK